MLNPRITAACIEAGEFPDMVRRYRISAVPKTIVNETVEILGALPEAMFVEQVLSAAAPSTRESQDESVATNDTKRTKDTKR
jgi:alkyl hydroperoxide reductase subunit AhpF